MPTGRITKTAVDKAEAGPKDWLLWDDKLPGFGMKVTPSGSKVFVYQYRLGGRAAKVRRYTIGKMGKLTPDGARKEAERISALVVQGVDPQAKKVETKRQAIELAFKPYAERFAKECLKVKWASSYKYANSLLTTYAVPVLGDKPLPDIKRRDITAVIAPVRDKAATAHNLFSVIRRLFRWAVNEGDIEQSPIEGMEPPTAPESRDRVLGDPELAVVWKASHDIGYPFGNMVRLLILTGARREEIAGLEWSEFDHSRKMWTLPATRAKNGTVLLTPLSDLAVVELDALAARMGKEKGWPRKGLVLSTTGKTGISGFSRAKRRLDKEIAKVGPKQADPVSVGPWRLHDLRRTLATGMQQLGVRFEVVEAILNHVSGSKSGVAGIYQRHDWGPEKVKALQAWADHVSGLLSPKDETNVVQLAARA